MVLVLKKGATKKEIEEIDKVLHQQKSKGGFDAKKYNGTMPLLGSDELEKFLQGKDLYISFITELELLGYKDIPKNKNDKSSIFLVIVL
jgi:hypothetical protein